MWQIIPFVSRTNTTGKIPPKRKMDLYVKHFFACIHLPCCQLYIKPSKQHSVTYACILYMSLVVRKPAFAYAKTKTQISFAVTVKLISAFVFAIYTVHSLFFLNLKFQASSHLLWRYRLVCVRPCRKPLKTGFLNEAHIKPNKQYSVTYACILYMLIL